MIFPVIKLQVVSSCVREQIESKVQMLESVDDGFIDRSDSENIGSAFGNLILIVLEREVQLLPVGGDPYLVFQCRSMLVNVGDEPIETGSALEIRFYLL